MHHPFDNKTLVLHEQVKMLFGALPTSILANVCGALLALIIYDDAVSRPRLLTWIALLLLVTLGRFWHYRRFNRAQPSPAEMGVWYTQFRIGALVLAAAVGSAGFLLFVYDDETYQLTLALMMVCIAAFATSSLAPRAELAVVFLVIILAPLAGTLYLAHTGSGIHAFWLMLVLLGMLIASVIRIARTIARGIELTIEARIREGELHNFQQRLSGYVRETPLAVIEWSSELRVTAWNPAAARMFGYQPEEATGGYLGQLLFRPADLQVPRTLWDNLVAQVNGHQLVVENRRRDGSTLQCEWFNTLVADDSNQPLGVMSLVQDVTQRLANERLKQEFISIVSHELRTPVTSIKGSLGLLASGVLDGDPVQRDELLDIALQNANRLHLLINDILDVDKLESGAVRFDLSIMDIGELLASATASIQPYAQEYGIALETRIDSGRHLVLGDPDRLTQVLTNILSNAIKFSVPGGVVVASLASVEGRLRVAVNNRGEVIPDAERKYLFSKFYQRDSTDTRRRPGTGLGLYICQRILQRHDSLLDFTSSVADGTTFYFDLAPVENPEG